jgi:hypothetical protein
MCYSAVFIIPPVTLIFKELVVAQLDMKLPCYYLTDGNKYKSLQQFGGIRVQFLYSTASYH